MLPAVRIGWFPAPIFGALGPRFSTTTDRSSRPRMEWQDGAAQGRRPGRSTRRCRKERRREINRVKNRKRLDRLRAGRERQRAVNAYAARIAAGKAEPHPDLVALFTKEVGGSACQAA